MEFKQAIYSRRAVREYTDESIPRSVLLKLIDAATQAPSSVNEQPWLFTVARDRTVLEGISREAKTHVLRAPSPLITCTR